MHGVFSSVLGHGRSPSIDAAVELLWHASWCSDSNAARWWLADWKSCTSTPWICKHDALWQLTATRFAVQWYLCFSISSCLAEANCSVLFLPVRFWLRLFLPSWFGFVTAIGCIKDLTLMAPSERKKPAIILWREWNSIYMSAISAKKRKIKSRPSIWNFVFHCSFSKNHLLCIFFRSNLLTFMPQTSQMGDHPSSLAWYGPLSSTFRYRFVLKGSKQ